MSVAPAHISCIGGHDLRSKIKLDNDTLKYYILIRLKSYLSS